MSLAVKEGNYLTLGADVSKNQVTFTFEGEKEDVCRIILQHKTTKERQSVTVPDEYCMGSLRSVAVSGFHPQEYHYWYEINGKEIVDPYASVIVGREKWNDESRKAEKYRLSAGFSDGRFAWGQDKNPEISKSDMVMYKLHVRGFSMGQKNGGKARGTFQAVRNRIPYLKDLGITTVELMPVYEFEEMPVPKEVQVPDYVKCQPETADRIQAAMLETTPKKINFWGYGKGDYFAVKASYAAEPEKASLEYKKLIKALHENRMECVMEIFFPETSSHNMILDVLHYWVREYHVDGFHIIGGNLPITSIVQDPILSRTKIFAEHFDGQYDLQRKYKNLYIYKEEYQYAARQLLNNYDGDIREFINQQKKQGEDYGFVNYIANNNGFTLADLFMYCDKHNEANGENNCDGTNFNLSNNYGVEGPTRKRFINDTRRNKMRMAFTMLMFAQGVPLIYAGDEFGNTQGGNNNAYCQDNEIGWVNWSQFAKYKEEREYIKQLIQFRKEYSLISKDVPFKLNDYRSMGTPDLSYHGENAWVAQLDPGRKSLGMLYCGAYAKEGSDNSDIYIGYNFYSEEVQLALPRVRNKAWYLEGEKLEDQQYATIPAQSIRVLFGKEIKKTKTIERSSK